MYITVIGLNNSMNIAQEIENRDLEKSTLDLC